MQSGSMSVKRLEEPSGYSPYAQLTTKDMNFIRTTYKTNDPLLSASHSWTNLSSRVAHFINNHPDVFRALARSGAPFGESITARRA